MTSNKPDQPDDLGTRTVTSQEASLGEFVGPFACLRELEKEGRELCLRERIGTPSPDMGE
jgi:hypothetical protein